MVALVGPVIGQMEAARADYNRADQIPTGFLGLTSAPWLFLILGGLLIVMGLWGLVRPSTHWSLAIAAVGLALVVAPLMIGIPGKINAAVRVTRLGKIGLAPTTGHKAVGATALFDGMARDVSTKLEPALAGSANRTTTFATDFPALASFTTNWESTISAQSHALSDGQVALAPTFASAVKNPLCPLPWLFILSGGLLTLLGGLSTLPIRHTNPAVAPALSPSG